MDNIRFVLETPQATQAQKKRPRLVTSCDNCRLKKIKCVPSSLPGKCEACEAGNVSCAFRDRERYFAERSRSVAAAAGGSSASTSSASSLRRGSRSPANTPPQRSNSRRSPRAVSDTPAAAQAWYTPSTTPELIQQAPFTSTPPFPSSIPASTGAMADWILGEDFGSPSPDYFGHAAFAGSNYVAPATSSGVPDAYGAYAGGSMSLSPSITGPNVSMLFDPRRPQHPDPALMPHFLQVFDDFYGSTFPFLPREDLVNRVRAGTIYGLLECAIAALAARHSKSSTVLRCGVAATINAFSNKAKAQLQDSSLVSFIQVLHTVIILAWVEYRDHNAAGLYEYTSMANKMALSLGLGRDSFTPGASERDRVMYRDTWTSVRYLQQLNRSLESNSQSALLDSSIFTNLPTGSASLSDSFLDDLSRQASAVAPLKYDLATASLINDLWLDSHTLSTSLPPIDHAPYLMSALRPAPISLHI